MKNAWLKVNLGILVLLLALVDPLSLMADPITATGALAWWASAAIAASLSAVSIGINYLLRPKIKPMQRDRAQGDIQLSNIGEDVPINEIYGGRQADALGGIRTGGTLVYASSVRKIAGTQPSSGTGKKHSNASSGTQDRFFQDYAFVVGLGPLNVLDIKANVETIYNNFSMDGDTFPTGTVYEFESLGTGVNIVDVADATLHGGHGLRYTGFLQANYTFTGITRLAGEEAARKIWIQYKTYWADGTEGCYMQVNGGVMQWVPLPNSNSLVANVMVVVNLDVGSNTILIQVPETTPIMDCLIVGYPTTIHDIGCTDPNDPNCDGCLIAGGKDPNYPIFGGTYNNGTLAVTGSVQRPCDHYNYQAKASATGTTSADLASGTGIRIYEGNSTQLADPMLQTYFESKYGVGATPAYRGRCLVVIENFELTKYGTSMPNFSFMVEHKTAKSLGAMYQIRALRAGLVAGDLDFSALNGVPLRGYLINQRQAPKTEMAILDRIFDVDVIQDPTTGKIKGVIPDYSVDRTIPLEELDVIELSSGTAMAIDAPPNPVDRTVVPDEAVHDFFDVSFYDASKPGTISNVHDSRQVTASAGKESIETGLVMTQAEAQRFATRDLQKQWVQKDPVKITTFWKHLTVQPTKVIKVQNIDSTYTQMQVKSVQGMIPSVVQIAGVACDIDELAPRAYEGPSSGSALTAEKTDAPAARRVVPPAIVRGTMIDLMHFNEADTGVGMYAAACLYDSSRDRWQAATVAFERSSEWVNLGILTNQATMGQTTGALGAVPGGWTPGAWDTTNSVQVTLGYGELESASDADVLAGANRMVIGNEVIAFATATLNSSVTNTWTVSRLQRRLNSTAVTHATVERAVLIDGAVKWMPMESTEIGIARTFVFLSPGQEVDDTITTTATLSSTSTDADTISAIPSEDATGTLLVNWYLSGGVLKVRKADYTDPTKEANGYITNGMTTGVAVTINLKPGEVMTWGSDLVIGTYYYLAASGLVASTSPSTPGYIRQGIGKAEAVRGLVFAPEPPLVKA